MGTTRWLGFVAVVSLVSATCSSRHAAVDGATRPGEDGMQVGSGGAVGSGGSSVEVTSGTGTGGAVSDGGRGAGGDAGAGVDTPVLGDGSAGGPVCGNTICAANQTCCECGVCINPSTAVNCPAACTASSCGPSGAPCKSDEICQDVVLLAEGKGAANAKCIPNPCGAQPLDCSCVGNVCQDANPLTKCTLADPGKGTLVCQGIVSVCASPDTPIATPEGDRPIADLKPGDLVYSENNGALAAVPLLKTTRRAAFHHFVVHLVTKAGAVLDISAPHPTADGRTFTDLKVGDALDGDLIVVRELVPYPYAYTYDILPASSTGTYVASGRLIGSTLK